jgi:hypothetical protein
MIIHEFESVRSIVGPDEADAKLVVHANGPLSLAVSGQWVKPVPWWHFQIIKCPGRVELSQPTTGGFEKI